MTDWTFRHSIEVRYPDCDMQRVVYNAHYLTYCDLAVSAWLAEAFGWSASDDDEFDWMLVKAVLEWRGSATFRDVLDVDLGISRWGTTSFDVRFAGSVAERPVFDGTITYVCVEPVVNRKMPVPAALKERLGPLVP